MRHAARAAARVSSRCVIYPCAQGTSDDHGSPSYRAVANLQGSGKPDHSARTRQAFSRTPRTRQRRGTESATLTRVRHERLTARDAWQERILVGAPAEEGPTNRAYARLARIYDVVFGRALEAGRVEALRALPLAQATHVLEVGVGTGLSLPDYPATCAVTGIDLSGAMLERAACRLAARGTRHIELHQMDAAAMRFADESFDVVSAAYVLTAVNDAGQVLREMKRVCRPGGHLVLLNHFLSANPLIAWLERLATPFTIHMGFRADVDLALLLADSGFELVSVTKVNRPRLWSLVVCRKSPPPRTQKLSDAGQRTRLSAALTDS